MTPAKRTGKCRICGTMGSLSFEHVPPKSAFNNKRVIRVYLPEALELGPDAKLRGHPQQRGMGDYTLCGKCNNYMGSWYGADFVNWCYQGLDKLYRAGGSPVLTYFYKMFPLRIIKQIVVMFFSINNPDLGDYFPELRKFVLDRSCKDLPPKFRFFVYFNREGKFRATGISSCLRIDKHIITVISEINCPPFGYVMTIDSNSPDSRLFEITHFSKYDYSKSALMDLTLHVLPTHLPLPGDYRTMKQIKKEEANGEVIKGYLSKK